jgi:hypothetical protein
MPRGIGRRPGGPSGRDERGRGRQRRRGGRQSAEEVERLLQRVDLDDGQRRRRCPRRGDIGARRQEGAGTGALGAFDLVPRAVDRTDRLVERDRAAAGEAVVVAQVLLLVERVERGWPA